MKTEDRLVGIGISLFVLICISILFFIGYTRVQENHGIYKFLMGYGVISIPMFIAFFSVLWKPPRDFLVGISVLLIAVFLWPVVVGGWIYQLNTSSKFAKDVIKSL
jgi:hypothetical protein